MTIEIVIEKRWGTTKVLGALGLGDRFRFTTNPESEVYIVMKMPDLDGDRTPHRPATSETIHLSSSYAAVYPCDADGKFELSGVEKVRADTLKAGDACLDKDGDLRLLTSRCGGGWNAVGVSRNREGWIGFITNLYLVTPVTIKKIVVHEGASDATGGGCDESN